MPQVYCDGFIDMHNNVIYNFYGGAMFRALTMEREDVLK